MRYAQVASGQRLHLVCEAGEETPDGEVIRAGFLSAPLCHRPWSRSYRMTVNLPLGHACKNCLRVYRSRYG